MCQTIMLYTPIILLSMFFAIAYHKLADESELGSDRFSKSFVILIEKRKSKSLSIFSCSTLANLSIWSHGRGVVVKTQNLFVVGFES